jgi:hypothetical protein
MIRQIALAFTISIFVVELVALTVDPAARHHRQSAFTVDWHAIHRDFGLLPDWQP